MLLLPGDKDSTDSSSRGNRHVVLSLLPRESLVRPPLDRPRHRIRPFLQVSVPSHYFRRPTNPAELAQLRLLTRAVADPLRRPRHLTRDLENCLSWCARSPSSVSVATAEDGGTLCLACLSPWPVGSAFPKGF